MKKITDVLSSGRMTVVSGIFLACSLVCLFAKTDLWLDPALGAVVISGTPLALGALKSLWADKRITADLLVTVAMISCLILKETFAAGEIAFIMMLGETLEGKTIERAKKGLHRLMELVPSECNLIDGDAVRKVPTSSVNVGEEIRILPGETIPLDGIVKRGTTSINQSAMTGESIPVDKSVGDRVLSGSLNCFGSIDITVTHIGAESAMQRLIQMVHDAGEKRAPMQKKVDKWASWLVPAALLLAVITYFCTMDVIRAVTILVVFCPCALVLATPTAIMAAIGQASKYGVLIKSGEALETMSHVSVIAFDKTGTLTVGKPSVIGCSPIAPYTEKELLRAVGIAEMRSEHPLAKAIMEYVQKNEISLADPDSFSMTMGKGVKVSCEGKTILCGSEAYIRESGVLVTDELQRQLSELRSRGCVTILCSIDCEVAGVVILSDVLRPETPSVVQELQGLNVSSIILTGDHYATAAYFASKAHISNVKAELLPEDKSKAIAELQEAGNAVCVIGDGINDAPALKTANIGIAMGENGSDIAIDAADIALLRDNLNMLPYLKRLANAVSRSITVNISISMAINTLAILLSVLGLMGPVAGALVHNAGSVLVVLNAALLYDRKI